MRNKSSIEIAISLVNKMIQYERNIDKKKNPTDAERRHVELLRTIIRNTK